MRRRFVSLCDWLPPDFGAVGQYSIAAAREAARAGAEVTLVGLSSGGSSRSVEETGTGRLTIVRVAATIYAKERWRARLIWTFFSNIRLLRAAGKEVRHVDEILFTGAPPFMLLFITVANLVWRKKLVYRITDFYPECLIAALGREPLYLRVLLRVTWLLRRRVDAFQALGLDQMRKLEAIGIPRSRITIHRDPSPVVLTGREQALDVPDAIRGHNVLLYSGNWGLAHDVGTFVDGYIRHHRQGSGRVALWLNAVGAGALEVEQRLRDAAVPFARTLPLPLDRLGSLLITADAHLITLKDAFVGYVMPSKVHGCIASRRPILFVGSGQSDVALLCSQATEVPWYRRVDTGHPDEVASALEDVPQVHALGFLPASSTRRRSAQTGPAQLKAG